MAAEEAATNAAADEAPPAPEAAEDAAARAPSAEPSASLLADDASGALVALRADTGAAEDVLRSGLCDLGLTADGLRLAYLTLRLEDADLTDVSGVAKFRHLQAVHVAGNKIADLQPLAGLRSLTRLSAPRNALTAALALDPGLPNLREADLSFNKIAGLPPTQLEAFRALRVLRLRGNGLAAAVGLGMLRSLQVCDLAENALLSLEGIEGLPLKQLDVSQNQLVSLAPVARLAQIEALNAEQNQIASADGLGAQPRLSTLRLGRNCIGSLEALRPLAALPMLRTLELAGNAAVEPAPGGTEADVRLDVVYLVPQLSALDGAPVDPETKVAAFNKHGGDLAELGRIREAHFPAGELDDGGGAPPHRTPAAGPKAAAAAGATAAPLADLPRPEVQICYFDARSWSQTPVRGVKPPPQVRSTLKRPEGPRGPLTILHFNDVYEIGEGKQEPVGGASRFTTLIRNMGADKPLVLFSGDALNPSLLSQVTKGTHMIECLNEMGIAVACVGNHDLDFGVENLNAHIQKSNFPWLCSNCWHADSGLPLGGAEECCVLIHEGYKIGVIGLIEDDWLACCTTVDIKGLEYADLVEVGRELAKRLKDEEHCDYVIAVTHFREPNDERLASEAPEIDLVLGGHDHHYAAKKCDPTGTWYVKSGADFRMASKIVMNWKPEGGRGDVTVEKLEITRAIPEDPKVLEIAEGYLQKLRAAMQKKIGELSCELDARFSAVRTTETNCGNWCSDVMRVGCRADIGLLNSGTLRADVVYPAGPFTVEDLVKLLPFANELMVVEVSGAAVIDLLENGVSQWPKKEGRFPCVSNIKFVFDGSKPAGERVFRDTIKVGGEPLDLKRHYTVAALDFAAKGLEGYTAFKTGQVIMDEEQATPLGTLMRNHLTCLEIVNRTMGLKTKRPTVEKAAAAFGKLLTKRRGNSEAAPIANAAQKSMRVDPKVEGRVINVADLPPGYVFNMADHVSKPVASVLRPSIQVTFFDMRSHHFPPTDDVVPPPQVRSTLKRPEGPRGPLTILHFNDVYEIGEGKQEPVGGAPRFTSLIKGMAADKPLVLFSGDALNPSLLSQVTKGTHMIECLNEMGIAVACVGNHDLDFGVENLNAHIQKSNFPWLCSNCWHADSGLPLGGAEECCVLIHEGYKIGVIGLIEDDWLACCTTIDVKTLQYFDFVETGRELAKRLKAEEHCDYVIALTHFREPNDERLAVEAPEIDIVLGGHDHHYAAKQCDPTGTWYVKSGADFRTASKIVMNWKPEGGRGDVTVAKLEVTKATPEDATVSAIAEGYLEKLRAAMQKKIGELGCELDARFAAVRTMETNCGNWCSDVMRVGCHADIGLLNSGTLRADVVYPAGPFTVEDLVKLLPFSNELMVVEVTGAAVLDLLENGVSQWPKKEGRFPCVSNITFTFDGNKPAGERVVRDSVKVGGEPIDLEKHYKVAALDFAAKGKEGYGAFLTGEVIMDEEQATPLGTLMRNHLTCLDVMSKTLGLKTRRSALEKALKGFARTLTRKRREQTHQHTDEYSVAGAQSQMLVEPKREGRIVNLAGDPVV